MLTFSINVARQEKANEKFLRVLQNEKIKNNPEMASEYIFSDGIADKVIAFNADEFVIKRGHSKKLYDKRFNLISDIGVENELDSVSLSFGKTSSELMSKDHSGDVIHETLVDELMDGFVHSEFFAKYKQSMQTVVSEVKEQLELARLTGTVGSSNPLYQVPGGKRGIKAGARDVVRAVHELNKYLSSLDDPTMRVEPQASRSGTSNLIQHSLKPTPCTYVDYCLDMPLMEMLIARTEDYLNDDEDDNENVENL